ncbi:MAG: hypothetical protein K1X87_11250 [Dehalococcoidia bacterium]|nr:hypothetical protein [Dehalococcoidia bacterium]HRC61969.1 hypothetical protein [Dehalococcoidia bacterium]
MPEGVPAYILVVRIATILGMAFSIAIGLLLLIGGFVLPSLVAFALFVPSIATMVYAEKRAALAQTNARQRPS